MKMLESDTRPQSTELSEFAALVERYQPIVYRWAIGLVSDRDEADDIMQEVFVTAYQKLESFKGQGTFDGWLYRITRRVTERKRRKAKRHAMLGILSAARSTAPVVYTTDPGGRVDRERALASIYESANELPRRQREVFDLCDMQGHSPTDAGEMLGLSAVSVRASLFKARAAIRRRILAEHPLFQDGTT